MYVPWARSLLTPNLCLKDSSASRYTGVYAEIRPSFPPSLERVGLATCLSSLTYEVYTVS